MKPVCSQITNVEDIRTIAGCIYDPNIQYMKLLNEKFQCVKFPKIASHLIYTVFIYEAETIHQMLR